MPKMQSTPKEKSAASQAPGQNSLPSAAPSSAFSTPSRLAKSSGGRGTALLLLAVGVGITIFDWYLLKSQHEYSAKSALAGPCLAIMGLVGLPFPQALEKNGDDATDKIARAASITLGIAAGALNWYLLAH